jgi:Kef-type K+ transport system membrane component KefB
MATITVMQLSATFVIVTAAMALTGVFPLHVAALLGAIATATSPTATVTIVRDLKARGSFIDHLYGAIPLDDAGCLVLFAMVTAFSGGFLAPEDFTVPESLLHFGREMAGSLVLGLATGFAMKRTTIGGEDSNSVYIISLGLICLMTALASTFELSPLLAGMSAGAVMANSPKRGVNVINSLDRLSPPLYAVFFAIAGSELDFTVFRDRALLLVGVLYILTRAIGKYGGVWSGAVLSRSGKKVRNYLGLAMMPHSGVTIGLILYIQASPPSVIGSDLSALMVNIVLMSVFINELVGPLLSKFAIRRGSETCSPG